MSSDLLHTVPNVEAINKKWCDILNKNKIKPGKWMDGKIMERNHLDGAQRRTKPADEDDIMCVLF